MLTLRLAKVFCVAALALYAGLVAFGNLSDYWTNFAFVTHVLDMDQLPPDSPIRWRAITSVTLHHAAYLLIIGTEIAIALLAVIGALSMARKLKADAQSFQNAKSMAAAALALGFLLYEGGFVAVAGEWFGMWQAKAWNGVESAFRAALTMLGVLIFVSMKDEELPER
jgi:predicted small integral membrane protein